MNLKQEIKDAIVYDYLLRVKNLHIEDDDLFTYRDGLTEGIHLALDTIERVLNDKDSFNEGF